MGRRNVGNMNNVFRPDSYSTPCYLFSKKALQNTYVQYKNTYCRCKICYAMKANGEAEVLQALSSIADGIEVANYDEFSVALDNGFSIDKIICSAPVKILNDLIKMYQGGCRYFVFDYMSEYNRLLQYASEKKEIYFIFQLHVHNSVKRLYRLCKKIGKCYTDKVLGSI